MLARWRRRGEDGFVAIVVAILFSTIMLVLGAVGVDVARWYVEAERVQNAADSAALAGVVFLPDNFPRAVQAARANAELNGYRNGVNAEVDVTVAERRSQLEVVIRTDVPNQFGRAINIDTTEVTRRAVADYTSPAPMGSPCNTFGNEPVGGNDKTTGHGASGPRNSQIPKAYTDSGICSSQPNFWAAIEGPLTDKQNGDRYGTSPCTLTPKPFGCNGNQNAEAVYPEGYFFAIKVPQTAVGTPITVQLYDPAYFGTGANCTDNMPATTNETSNTLNDFVTDALLRYTQPSRFASAANQEQARRFCSGDSLPRRRVGASGTAVPPTTSFAIRSANDAQDPLQGPAVNGCTAQFPGFANPPTLAQLTKGNGSYQDAYARLWHQWVPLCTFTPTRAGDYYLQTRTNVSLAGSTEAFEVVGGVNTRTRVYRNNPNVVRTNGNDFTSEGVNGFSIRAVSTKADRISVSGWSRMPMLQNVPNSTATFNLLRVLPSAAGQSISFEFFDVADGADDKGTVQVIPPAPASGPKPAPYTNCKGALNAADFGGDLSQCTVTVTNATHNGQVQRMSIPIPTTYTCKDTELTGCWFQVKITLNGDITDFTTWDASLEGDPVRLIE